jgi:hypothetical protein
MPPSIHCRVIIKELSLVLAKEKEIEKKIKKQPSKRSKKGG